MSHLLKIAIQEEKNRRKASCEEFLKLSVLVKEVCEQKYCSQEEALKLIEEDIATIIKLNEYLKTPEIKKPATGSLVTNKNFEIFHCAKEKLENDFELLISESFQSKYPINPEMKIMLGGGDADVKGTSIPNCLQTAMLTVLRTVDSTEQLVEQGVYDINVSPNIHTTKFPNNFDSEEFVNWFYYYKDEQSPKQGELMFPTLGYAFGGSRGDERHQGKKFKAEDCSASVSKWLGSKKPFATLHMKQAFKGDCDNDYCSAVAEVLEPIGTGVSNVFPGDIFVFRTEKGGHTGVVINVDLEHNCFENLSYSRGVPLYEGLGYRADCIDDHPERDYMFFHPINETQEVFV